MWALAEGAMWNDSILKRVSSEQQAASKREMALKEKNEKVI
jgi:hypothetical protein